jgi:hypothetical protein
MAYNSLTEALKQTTETNQWGQYRLFLIAVP